VLTIRLRTLRIAVFSCDKSQQRLLRQARAPDVLSVESLTQALDVAVEVVLVENLIQSPVERMRSTPPGSWVATHIDACFACRRRLPIAIGDSVVRGFDRVDS
jgi:hypothetical protein